MPLVVGRISIVKMSVLPQLTYRSSAFLIKFPAGILVDLGELIQKSKWEGNGTR